MSDKLKQTERVMVALRRGGTDIRDWPQGFRLAARISDLRAEGVAIDSKPIKLPGGTRCSRYTLAQLTLDL